ncbi:MAG: hypothetical protein JW763_05265 [candidate division Zixibacteria bacterium]|nr:hypothetical protein [candidate division Zixibacteria bacterium]
MRMMLKILLPLGMLMVMTAGCYTVIMHPVSDEDYTQHDYQQDCLSCHPDYHEYPYGYFYGNYPDYWWDTPRYGHYYAYPWWWDHYWYRGGGQVNTGDNDDTGSPRSEEAMKASRRDALRPPYTTGAMPTAITRGTTTTTESGRMSGSSAGNSTGTSDNNSSSTKTETKTKDEQEKEKKASRRDGRRK